MRMATILSPRMAYLATGRTKEDDNEVFSSVYNSSTSRSRQATEAHERVLLIALGAEDGSTLQIRFRTGNAEETLNVLLLHEMTRIRNVRRNSKHFLTIKVDFLTNNVVLRTKRTMTVSRMATNDFRTESERLAYGCALNVISCFWRGGGLGGLRACSALNFKCLYLLYGYR